MSLEQFLDLYTIVINVVGLMTCMFRHVNRPRRAWVYAIIFELGNLLSNYYWGAYDLLMNETPNISSLFAYFGWNLCYVPLVFLLIMRGLERKEKFFSPLCLLPIPLNVFQFTLYLPYGGLFNNIWQSFWCTAISCLSLHGILCYLKNRKKGSEKPYIAFVLLIFSTLEYTMWTSSCFDWPSVWLNPYTYASILVFLPCLALPWAISKVYREGKISIKGAVGHFQAVIKPIYIGIVLVCCVGGYLIGIWMRNVLSASFAVDTDPDPYSIIAVTLFIFSMILVSFSAAIIMIVSFGNRAAESDELRREKSIAESSNAAKSDFLANMSHEIRTPINAVLGMNEMILRESVHARDSLPQDREEIRSVFSDISVYAGNLENAGNNLLSLINDILDFSKIEANKLTIVEGDYRLSGVLNDVINMTALRARDKRLDFSLDLDDTLPDSLYGDGPRVRQVITNLLSNAVKYTKRGCVTLAVSRDGDAPEEAGTIALRISVRDTGIGIRQEDADKLFSKFERLDLTQNSTVEGSGLGLAITYRLLNMMGGRIEVKSTYGVGSDFIVYLRQKVNSPEPVGNFREQYEKGLKEIKAYEESFRAPGARVLIVDDTQMNLTVAKSLLKNTGVRIDTALSGQEAIDLAQSTPYDLILMDQRMPGMDGTEAMRRIKEMERSPNLHTPIICLTADAISGAKERYLAVGFSDYLSKPIDSGALEKMLIAYLPKEKLLLSKYAFPGGEEARGPLAEEAFAGLREAGIDPAVGLQYCQNDAVLYQSLLSDYSHAAKEKGALLQSYFDSGDWKNYGIFVHSLKSSSRMIGASSLSGIAARMEAAAAREDVQALHAEHTEMMRQYSAVLQALACGAPASAGEDEDAEIMEFMPEQPEAAPGPTA